MRRGGGVGTGMGGDIIEMGGGGGEGGIIVPRAGHQPGGVADIF